MQLLLVLIAVQLSPLLAIYDGYKARPHQFPYIVLLNSPRFYCAGALISSRHVLTAAHCLMSVKPGKAIKVTLGAHEYYGSAVSDGKLIESTRFWIHENFSMPSAVNDIGLVELPKAIVSSVLAQSVGVDRRRNADESISESVVIAGWGHVRPGTVATQLRYTTLKLLAMRECVKYSDNYIESLTLNHICATKITNLPCDGDSGTPLVSQRTGKIVGVLSYVKDAEKGVDMGKNDCKTDVPVVATRISSYIDWIAEKSKLKF